MFSTWVLWGPALYSTWPRTLCECRISELHLTKWGLSHLAKWGRGHTVTDGRVACPSCLWGQRSARSSKSNAEMIGWRLLTLDNCFCHIFPPTPIEVLWALRHCVFFQGPFVFIDFLANVRLVFSDKLGNANCVRTGEESKALVCLIWSHILAFPKLEIKHSLNGNGQPPSCPLQPAPDRTKKRFLKRWKTGDPMLFSSRGIVWVHDKFYIIKH